MLLNQRKFLVKERVSFLKLADTYDLFDPETNRPSGTAKEEVSGLVKALRLIIAKKLMPTTVRVYESEGTPAVLTLKRNVALFRPSVTVMDAKGVEIGRFQGKFFRSAAASWYSTRAASSSPTSKATGKAGTSRSSTTEGRELGIITKKWAGIGKELFTNADNYIISITDPTVNPGLILAAGLAIDIIFKEKQG